MSAQKRSSSTSSTASRKGGLREEKPVTETILNKAVSTIMSPPPSLIEPTRQFLTKVMLRPSQLKVYSVDLGCSASRAVVSSLVGSRVLSTALGAELTAASAFTSAAQIQSLGLLALRIPLRAAGALVGEGPAMGKLVGLITEYATRNAGVVSEMAQMGAASQVITVGMKGTVLGAIATAAVQESIAVAYYCHGGGTFDVLRHQTATIGMSAASTVGGGTVGAAVGCLVLPGVGTAVGSLLGGYVGAMVPFYTRGDGYAHQKNEDPRHPSRKLKSVDVQPLSTRTFKGNTTDVSGGWLEIVDCSTESYFRFSEEGSGTEGIANGRDSIAMLRSLTQRSFHDEDGLGAATPSNSSLCGYGGHSTTSTQRPLDKSSTSKQPSTSTWASFLNPSFLFSGGAGSTASASATPPAPQESGYSSSFFVNEGDARPKVGDDEVIIYFRPLDENEDGTAGNLV